MCVEKREHANEGTYRGVKHNTTIENNNINIDLTKIQRRIRS